MLGPVRLLDAVAHLGCNWSVEPSGGAREVDEVRKLLDGLRRTHPLIRPD